MTSSDNNRSTTTPVIETASATTSPDNAKSGNGAYLIAALALGFLLLVGSGISGCMRFASSIVEESHAHGTSWPQDEYNDDEFDDYLEEYFNQFYDDEGYGDDAYGEDENDLLNNGMGTVPVRDLVGSNLSIYQPTIDSLLPAMSYANAQESVRTFVRGVVVTDRDASSELASALRSASWNDGDVSGALKDAATKAQETIETLQAMEFPEVKGDGAANISRNLEVARGKAIDRWKAIGSEIEALSAADEVNVSAISTIDDQVAQAAQEAADAFDEALTESAGR